MEHTQAISPYVAVNSANFEKRFRKLLKTRDKEELDRFATALDELEQTKADLVAKFSSNPMIGYKVPGGLGAVCVTCVEEYVTDILTRNGFQTEIHARQLSDGLWPNEHRRPGIHAYNVVNICGTNLLVDMDADPFVGRNVGIVVAPLQIDIVWYSSGFLYHCRSVGSTGKITGYKFSFQDKDGQICTYLEGDTADYLTITPYHDSSEDNLCPLCLARGATVYFGFEKYYIGCDGPHYRISFTLVCPVYPKDREHTYQIAVDDVRHIKVNALEISTRSHRKHRDVLIIVSLTNGHHIKFLLGKDGMLLANDFVSFVPVAETSSTSFKFRLSAENCHDFRITLPRPARS